MNIKWDGLTINGNAQYVYKAFVCSDESWRNFTWVQLYASNNDATDLEICVSGGRVRANVGKSFLRDVSWCVQNFYYATQEKKEEKNHIK